MSDTCWHILGAGAIGSLWAAELHAAERMPVLILKDASRLQQYRRAKGVTIRRSGNSRTLPIAATSPENLSRPIHRLLITTKAHQTLSALAPLGNNLADDAVVVLMQNGLGVLDELCEHYGGLTIYQASTTVGAYRRTDFDVVHAGRGDTVIGASGGGIDAELRRCAEALSTPLLPAHITEEIDRVLWRKLAVNCAINPVTALLGCRNGELPEKPEAQEMIHRIVDEIETVSRALERSGWVENLETAISEVAAATADNRSSMLQDIEAGRATEIDCINGYLCSVAESLGIDVPANRDTVGRIHAMERKP